MEGGDADCEEIRTAERRRRGGTESATRDIAFGTGAILL